MALLDVKNVRKVYTTRFGGNQVEALKDVNFSVEQGEYVAIMGESGSGKSTLLNILAALDTPTEGKVFLKEKDLSKVKEKEMAAFRRNNLGFVFQDFNLLDTFSLKDNIFLPLVLSGTSHKEMERRLLLLADKFGIKNLLEKYPYEVSGGQKQRAAIARAVITQLQLLLADEPTGALDAVGLANICILSTMVLVMVSMTVSLYGGMNDVIATRFPYEAQITSSGINQKEEEQIEEIIKNMTKKNHTVPTSQIRFHMGRFTTVYNNKTKKFNMMAAGNYANSNAADLVMIPLSDYNQTEGKNIKLKENEVLLYHRNHKKSDTEAKKNKKVIQLNSSLYKVVDELDRLAIAKADTTSFIDGWYVVVKDSSIITSYLKDIYENSNIYDELKEYYGKIQYSYSFNLNGSRANRAKTEKSIQKQLQKKFANCSIESRELSRESFYELYGGFLFIGIFLGIILLMATTLIIYYKQISEGYDDRERYQIMQKVGMSKKEVRQSIRSQVLLVFFLPLIMAVIHLAFAFKIITKLLSVLNLTNISLFFMYTVGTVAIFAVIYAIIYSITAREYYKILV